MAVCKNCGASHRPHHMCLECGFYKGRQVIDLVAQKKARAERIKAKKDMMKAQAEQIAPTEAEAASEASVEEAIDEKKS